MDETEKAAAEAAAKEAAEKAEPDAFGQAPNPPAPAPEGEGEQKPEKKFDAIPEDHPTIVALKAQIDSVKTEYGGNLSGQRELIKTLNDKIEALSNGKVIEGEGGTPDVLFKDIKRSKDLTKEERDDMTDTEIRQMDQIADMQEAQNKMYADSQKKNKEEDTSKKAQETEAVNDLNTLVQTTATVLAREANGGKDNVELANQIIESSKQFNLAGLDEKTVKERVMSAAKLLPTYTPPKEQTTTHGKTVKDTAAGSDPFGVDKIVEEATKGSDGTYSL